MEGKIIDMQQPAASTGSTTLRKAESEGDHAKARPSFVDGVFKDFRSVLFTQARCPVSPRRTTAGRAPLALGLMYGNRHRCPVSPTLSADELSRQCTAVSNG